VELIAQVLDVLGLAAPAARSPDFGPAGERELGEMTSDEARDPGDENAYGHRRSP
jgi:hypothetical protein